MNTKKPHPAIIAIVLTLVLCWGVHFISDSTLEIPKFLPAVWVKILLSTFLVAICLFGYKAYASDPIEGGTRKSQYPVSDYGWSILGAGVLSMVLYFIFT